MSRHRRARPTLTGTVVDASVDFDVDITWDDGTFTTLNFTAGTTSFTANHTYTRAGLLQANIVAALSANGTLTTTATDIVTIESNRFAVGAGQGGGTVAVYDGAVGNATIKFNPYGNSFTGGVTVAVGNVNNEGYADIVTGSGPGMSFFAGNSSERKGARVAAEDLNGNSVPDVIVGAGASSFVQAYSGAALGNGQAVDAFYSLEVFTGFLGGVFVG